MTYYAEFQTDKIIRDKYFPDLSYKGIMVEVGAATPHSISMSNHFRENGWRCVCIDPNPRFAQEHRVLGNEIYEVACSWDERDSDFTIVGDGLSYSAIDIKYGGAELIPSTTIKIKVRRLNDMLKELGIDKIDFLSIDTEGWEIEVMMGFNAYKYNPKVILLENYTNDPFYDRYMTDIGYIRDESVHYNHIYIRDGQ